MANGKAVEFQDILDAFDSNMSRVQNLICLYNILIVERKKSKEGSPGFIKKRVVQEDVLRVALILLHASMEEFFRSLLKLKLHNRGAAGIGKLLIKNNNACKFSINEVYGLDDIKSKALVESKILHFLKELYRVGNHGKVKDSLKSLGIKPTKVNQYEYNELAEMIERRHNIVHNADKKDLDGEGQHNVKSLGLDTVKKYSDEVKKIRQFVSDNRKDIEG